MKARIKRTLFVMLTAVLVLSFAGSPWAAEEYPSAPITFVVPNAAGGMTDVTARFLAEKFRVELGQPVLVSNKVGGEGELALRYVVDSKADGYTLFVIAHTELMASGYFIEGRKPFNPKELSFVGGYMPHQRALFTLPNKPYKTFQEFIEYARKHPGEVTIASGASPYSIGVLKSVAVKENLKMKYLVSKSGVEASTLVLGEHVTASETGMGTPAYFAARAGKLIPLVYLGDAKVPFFPGLKNLGELGYPFVTVCSYGISAPAKLPEPIREKLEQTLKKVLELPEITEKFAAMGLTPEFTDGKAYLKIVNDTATSIESMLEYNKAVQR